MGNFQRYTKSALKALGCFVVLFLTVAIYKTNNFYYTTKGIYKSVNENLDLILPKTNAYRTEISKQQKTLGHLQDTNIPVQESLQKFKNFTTQNKSLILYWGNPWGDPGSGLPEGTKIGKCTITNNRKRLSEADAVAFHYTTIHGSDMPWKHYRNPKQIFVWWNAEPPAILNRDVHDLDKYNDFFNWSWTYRSDADVIRFYYQRDSAIKVLKKGKNAIDDIIKKKKKLALTLATNCGNTNGGKLRLKYGDDLIKTGFKLDRIGKCFGNSHLLPRSNPQQIKDTIKEYKFYMAFENSIHCKDYITEKFWQSAILNDAVPVVMGPYKTDYLRVAPMNSFIHVEDFESPQKLADYLNFLDKNETEYRKYFSWREDENMTDEIMMQQIREKYPNVNPEPRAKNICERISENKETKVIHSLLDEFAFNNPPECN